MELKRKGIFRGRYKRVLDRRNRLRIPDKYIESLKLQSSQSIVITNHISCLYAFPIDTWPRIEKNIASLGLENEDVNIFKRYFISGAFECAINGNTIIIPSDLVEIAGLDRNVLLIGQSEFFEIWDEEKWNRECQVSAKSFRKKVRGING